MRVIRWPRPGAVEVLEAEADQPAPGPDEVAVDVRVSVMSPGTERARFLGLPTAQVTYPHVAGYLAAGTVRGDAPGMTAGTRVAVRGARHKSIAVAAVASVRPIPDGVAFADAALWKLALTAMHGLAQGGHRSDEPLTVVGAGLLGATTRRLAAARGCAGRVAVAATREKEWTTTAEKGTRFVVAGHATASVPRAPLVVDATGTAEGLRTAMAMAADGGRVVLLGSPRVELASFPFAEVYDRGLRVTGAHIDTLHTGAEPALTEEFFTMLAEGRFSAHDLLTPWAVEDAPLAYRRLAEDRSFVGAAFHWQGSPARREPPPRAVAAPRRTGADPVRFALLGCGEVGVRDAEATVAAAGARLTVCCDPVAKLAEDVSHRWGCAAVPTADEALGHPDVDAVLIATPHHTHEALAVAALRAGKHVLLEKPLSVDLASAQRIAEAAERARTVTGVLFQLRWDERLRRARAAIDEGRLGAPLGAHTAYLVDKPPSYFHGGYSHRSPSSWRMSKTLAGGGFLLMNLIHHIDAVRSLLGTEADRVYAETVLSRMAPELDDSVTVVVRFGGAIATFVGGASVVGGGGQSLMLWGEAGQVRILPELSVSSLSPPVAGRASARHRPMPDEAPTRHSARTRTVGAFATAVRDGVPPESTVGDALAAQAIVEAAYESARRGRAVRPASLMTGRPA
ncbi:Gfo/Idh/MocA family oxidoreductase [Streptomyces sp. NPDC001339]|uniref:Gfo/Idh/MocA family oxidoreductase n=1 Tax=Streptomyces sp. NPDC001339 TaxID=3364563 RepID=UPI0036755688